MSVRCEIKNYRFLQKKLEDMKKAPRQVMTSVTADAKKRVPGWIAAEVTKVYGVKKGDITGQKIGRVKPGGGYTLKESGGLQGDCRIFINPICTTMPDR